MIPGPSLNINIGLVWAAMSGTSDLPRLTDLAQRHSGWPGVVTGEAHASKPTNHLALAWPGILSMAFSNDESGNQGVDHVVTLRHERGSSETSLITRSSPTRSPARKLLPLQTVFPNQVQARWREGAGAARDVGRYCPIPHSRLLLQSWPLGAQHLGIPLGC